MPTEIVLDTSAAAKLVRQEPESEVFRAWLGKARARGARLVVPEVFSSELRNVAAKALSAGELEDATEAAEVYGDVLAIVEGTSTSAQANIELAVKHSLSTHDAAYLLLAATGRALVTYDDRMVKVGRLLYGKDRVLSPR